MLRNDRPHARIALSCALVLIVVLVAPAAALARDVSTDRATRAALASERYWSTYDIDAPLPSPPRATQEVDDRGGGTAWSTTIVLIAATAVTACAAGVVAGRLSARRSPI